jgi:hypothetical protein
MIIAVDFDGTIVTDRFPEIGETILFAFEYLIAAKQAGNLIILHTCREDSQERKYLTEAVEFCRKNGLEFDAVNENVASNPYALLGTSRKPYADYYIDDKALSPQWNAFFK